MTATQTIKSELKMFILFFSLYFSALGICDLYAETLVHPNPYAFINSLQTILRNPLTSAAIVLLPITLSFPEYTETNKVDKSIFFLLGSYALGSFTAHFQYTHLIMTKSIILHTLLSGVMSSLFLCAFLYFFDFRADIKYILGVILSSYVIYITKLNLSFHFPSLSMFANTYSFHVIPLLAFMIIFVISRFTSKE